MSVEHVTAYRLSPHFRTQTSLAQCHWHGSKGSGKWKNKGVKVFFVFAHLSSYHLHPKTDRSAPSVPSIFHCTVLHQQRLQSIYVYSKSADLDNLSPFFTELTVHDSFYATSQSMFLCQAALSTRPIMKMWPSWIWALSPQQSFPSTPFYNNTIVCLVFTHFLRSKLQEKL